MTTMNGSPYRVSPALAGLCLLVVLPCAAQNEAPRSETSQTEAPQTEAPQNDPAPAAPPPPAENAADANGMDKSRPPSLDEMLGITEAAEGEGTRDVAETEADRELERRLDENELGNAFAEAIAKMGLSAEQLELHFDTGLGTQRIQEDILARLEHLLNEAKKQQGSASSSSSSSASSSAQSQSQPGKQAQKSQGQERKPNASDSSPEAGDPPARVDGDINTLFEEDRAEWGALPQRVRDLLLQGRDEKFSSVYEQLTREYYRRLAEEGSK